MRQCNVGPGSGDECTRRAWHVLALCTVAFQPCTTLKKVHNKQIGIPFNFVKIFSLISSYGLIIVSVCTFFSINW